MIRSRAKIVLPFVIIAAGIFGTWIILATAPDLGVEAPEGIAPLVRVVEVAPQTVQLKVTTYGTVSPRTESDLVPQVSGPVIWLSPSLISGGFFEQGDVLLRIEPDDYEVALERARANLARAQSEGHRAAKELRRLRGLAKQGVASQSQLDDAERADRVAAATSREAEAILEQAERDLVRTEVTAPFAGRVREEHVDVGQFVGRGAPIAKLYATDYAEVRLPIADQELAFLDLPLWHRGENEDVAGPDVLLRADFAGSRYRWTGRLVRTEGEIDAKSRMINMVARVENPYGRQHGESHPPLAVGLFVEAEILGREVDNVVVVPRSAMRDQHQILVVDQKDHLRVRRVHVVRRERHQVVIAADVLAPGDRVVLSSMETAVDGMRVRPVAVPPGLPGEASTELSASETAPSGFPSGPGQPGSTALTPSPRGSGS